MFHRWKADTRVNRGNIFMVGALVLLSLLILLATSSPSLGFTEVPQHPSPSSGTLEEGTTDHEVPIISGDVIIISESPDGTTKYEVRPADPAVGQTFEMFEDRNGTYIIPKGLSLSKLDVGLFNVEYLLREGFHQMGSLPVIITATDGSRLSAIEAAIKTYGGNTTFKFPDLSMLAATLPIDNLQESSGALLDRSDLKKIWLDAIVHVDMNVSVPKIGAPVLWEAGYEGAGIEVAILDTGIDDTHPDLDDLDDDPSTNDPKVLHHRDFTDDGTIEDSHGHGTHVGATVAGTGYGSNPPGLYKGVAPQANLWAVRVLNSQGSGQTSWIVAGIEYATKGPDNLLDTGDDNADVINMSLGASVNGDGTDPISVAVDWATDHGVVVALSAGNSGPSMFTVGQPGVARKVITVGASDDNDSIANFSSRGPTRDLRLKPDLVAPGVDTMSASLDGGYVSMSGTSMASPHVAGSAALILDARPGWTPLMVKSALMNTSLVLDGPNLWEQGAGRIRIPDAVETSVLAMDPSFSFGKLASGDETTETLTLTNLSEIQVDVDLTALTKVGSVEVDLVSVNPTSLTLPALGTGDVTLVVSVGPNVEGWYEGRVTATHTGTGGAITVPYLFNVDQYGDIDVSPTAIDESGNIFEKVEKIVNIHNTGLGDLEFSIEGLGSGDSEAAQWMCINPSAGELAPDGTQEITVSLNCLRDLELGTHSGRIKVTSDDPNENIVFVSVDLEVVQGPPPEIDVTPASLDVTLTSSRIASRTLNINNFLTSGDGGTLRFDITEEEFDDESGGDVTWLSTDLSSGFVDPGETQEIVVTLNSTGLSRGVHEATLVIDNNDPDENPLEVPVSLTVLVPVIDVNPVYFERLLDPDQVVTADFTISNSGTGDLDFYIKLNDTTPGVPVLPVPVENNYPPGAVAKYQSVTKSSSGIQERIEARTDLPAEAPSNDDFPGTLVESLIFVDSLDTTDATEQDGERQPCGGIGSTVWFNFTSTVDTVLIADTMNSGFDTVLAAYTGNSLQSLELLACNDDSNRTYQSEILVQAAAGETLFFQAGGFIGQEGELVFRLKELTVGGVDILANDLLAVSDQNTILRVNKNTGKATVIPTPEGADGGVDGLAASPDFLFFINPNGSNQIFKMTHNGQQVGIIDTPSDTMIEGLAFNEGVLYGLDPQGDRIYAFDPRSGDRIGSDVEVQTDLAGGLAPGPDRTLYAVDISGDIVQINPGDGEILTRVNDGMNSLAGLAFDGTYLVMGRADGNLEVIDPVTGIAISEITGLSGITALTIPPVQFWLSVGPFYSGTVAPGDNLDLVVTFDTTDLDPGLRTAEIIVENNDPERPLVIIPVTLLPPPPPPPCNGLEATIVGTEGDDEIHGTPGRDVIAGLGGNDVIHGHNGDDVICGGPGNDELHGDRGQDHLEGGPGDDELHGGNDHDEIMGDSGNDKLHGGNGDDVMDGGNGRDKLYGGRGHDDLAGGLGNDELHGGRDHDDMMGGSGNDKLYGGNGDDVMDGGKGRDELHGGRDHDDLKGGPGKDDLHGGRGDDDLVGGSGNDELHGGRGQDDLYGGAGADHLDCGPGFDYVGDNDANDTLEENCGVVSTPPEP